MITTQDIKNFLLTSIPKGLWLTLNDLQNAIQSNFQLAPDDWAPHTDSRPTTYPKWQNYLNASLQELKATKQVQHNPTNHTYKF